MTSAAKKPTALQTLSLFCAGKNTQPAEANMALYADAIKDFLKRVYDISATIIANKERNGDYRFTAEHLERDNTQHHTLRGNSVALTVKTAFVELSQLQDHRSLPIRVELASSDKTIFTLTPAHYQQLTSKLNLIATTATPQLK